MRFLARTACPTQSVTSNLCDNILFLFGGYNEKEMNETVLSRIPVYIGHNPAGTSIQNMMHYAQSYEHKNFQMYDYGSSSKNTQHYGQTAPPIYDVNKIETPVALFWGVSDSLAHPGDVQRMIPKLQNLVLNKRIDHWMHLDFIWAMDAPRVCYDDIIRIIEQTETASRES
ncbi:hypothetical protein ScPMuIL_003689 [Solemya velum]